MGILFGSLSAIALSLRNFLSKRRLDDTNEYILMFSSVFFCLPIGIVLVMLNGFTISSSSFWVIVVLRVFLDVVAYIAFLRAIKFREISLIIPLTSLVPVFSIITSSVISNQQVPAQGILGIIIVCASNILLLSSEINIKKLSDSKHLLKPFLYVLLMSVIWAFLDPVHNEGIKVSSPYTYFLIGNIAFTVVFFIMALFLARKELKGFFNVQTMKNLSPIGLLLSVEFVSQLVALGYTLVSYVSAIKSANIILTSILGIIFLKEKSSSLKVLSIILSLVGVLIIIFS